MEEAISHPVDRLLGNEHDLPSERKFGVTIGLILIVFGVINFFSAGQESKLAIILLVSGTLVFASGILAPQILKKPNYAWYKLGLVLYQVVNPVVLGLLFFLCITPIALLLRLFRKDILNLRIDKEKSSYWIEKEPLETDSMKYQF